MGLPFLGQGAWLQGTTYESNVVFALRFMVDCSLGGGNWVEVPAAKYSLVAEQGRQTHCQIEAHVRYDSLVSHAPEGEWARLAPFRILSVDIECQGRKVRPGCRLLGRVVAPLAGCLPTLCMEIACQAAFSA